MAIDAISYTAARNKLAKTMDKVCDDRAPVIITRQNQRSVVMMSLEDYNSLDETAFLLRRPANAARLAKSLQQAKRGKVIETEFDRDGRLAIKKKKPARR